MTAVSSSSFDVIVSYQGSTRRLSNVTTETTVSELEHRVREALSSSSSSSSDEMGGIGVPLLGPLKLIYKGKVLGTNGRNSNSSTNNIKNTTTTTRTNSNNNNNDELAFSTVPTSKTPKLLVLASSQEQVDALNRKRSDPTIRGFLDQQERAAISATDTTAAWGQEQQPSNHKKEQYKFCKLEACSWQQFGHRASDHKTPHAFQAYNLLHKLSTDPGIVRILRERELVVGTLGEMDPIDDRLKHATEQQQQQQQQHAVCLLGYNTNHGARIDLKLRPDSLEGFLPYRQIAATLIHELSHNWVGEHNLLFWTNFGQMRAEYYHTHASLAARGVLVQGKTTWQVAGLESTTTTTSTSTTIRTGEKMMRSIARLVLEELKRDMAQHGLTPDLIAPAIVERCRELTRDSGGAESGQTLVEVDGSRSNARTTTSNGTGGGHDPATARQRALAAAERRAREASTKERKENDDNNDDKKPGLS